MSGEAQPHHPSLCFQLEAQRFLRTALHFQFLMLQIKRKSPRPLIKQAQRKSRCFSLLHLLHLVVLLGACLCPLVLPLCVKPCMEQHVLRIILEHGAGSAWLWFLLYWGGQHWPSSNWWAYEWILAGMVPLFSYILRNWQALTDLSHTASRKVESRTRYCVVTPRTQSLRRAALRNITTAKRTCEETNKNREDGQLLGQVGWTWGTQHLLARSGPGGPDPTTQGARVQQHPGLAGLRGVADPCPYAVDLIQCIGQPKLLISANQQHQTIICSHKWR